jgi:hypothetical protein
MYSRKQFDKKKMFAKMRTRHMPTKEHTAKISRELDEVWDSGVEEYFERKKSESEDF